MKKENIFKRWKQGMKEITPLQQVHAQLIGTIGTIVGMIFAGTIMILNGAWYFIIVFVFVIFLQVISYIGLKQKYDNILEMEKESPTSTQNYTESSLDIENNGGKQDGV